MKRIVLITIIIAAFGLARAQDVIQNKDFDYTSYGQMIYWKTLTKEEKRFFCTPIFTGLTKSPSR